MNDLKKTLNELHGMLKTTEMSLRKALSHVVTVQKSKKCKLPAKAKKAAESTTFEQISTAKKAGPSPDDVCWHCNASGHWSRNCKKYLEENKKGEL